MHIDEFDFHLPEELIASYPAEKRDASRMMLLNRDTGESSPSLFTEFASYLSAGDTLVLNNTKVIPARIFGTKENGGAKIEALLMEPQGDISGGATLWQAMCKPAKRLKEGYRVLIDNSDQYFTVKEKLEDGTILIEFSTTEVLDLLDQCGHIPLPPYMQRDCTEDDKIRYQTVFAEEAGAIAAPTAGLHMTDEILAELKDKGVNIAYVTLHVGPGTFLPVSVDNITEHKMHFEAFEMPEETAETLKATKANGKKIFAIGTTSIRVLESCYDEQEFVIAQKNRTDIFLYPPFKARVADCLLTNFHLPKSTLIMLVSTFCDRHKVMEAYKKAVEEKFRFYSYGDCMLLHK